MGASSDEIDQEIRETRAQLDQKLGVLERRAAFGARRYGRIVAGVAAGLAAVAVGALVYRRHRQKAVVKQLRDAVFESVHNLPDEAASRLKRRLPIKVVVTDSAHEVGGQSAWAGIAGKIAPTIVGSATGAVVSRLVNGTPPEAAAE
jgi:hypothetical protein